MSPCVNWELIYGRCLGAFTVGAWGSVHASLGGGVVDSELIHLDIFRFLARDTQCSEMMLVKLDSAMRSN